VHDLSSEGSNSFKVAVFNMKVFRCEIKFVFWHGLSGGQDIAFDFIKLPFDCGCQGLLCNTGGNEGKIEDKKA
jgi:hypothetical protein